MERTRATWTDERLDDLSQRVDHGLNRVDEELRSLRSDLGGRISSLESRVDSRFDAQEVRTDSRFESVEKRLDALQRTMIVLGGGIVATLISVLATRA